MDTYPLNPIIFKRNFEKNQKNCVSLPEWKGWRETVIRMDSSYWEPMPECWTAPGAGIFQIQPGGQTFKKSFRTLDRESIVLKDF